MAPPTEAKTVYLVRHAQSEQNCATRRLQDGDPSALINLANLGYDAPVSKEGQGQLDAARAALESLVSEKSIELVAHSPLQRARDTAMAVFRSRGPPIIELPQMYERTVSEYLWTSLLDARIENVCQWLSSREETVVALVGHGQFFKRCLGASRVQRNIEIIECSFNAKTGFGAFRSVFEGYAEPKGASEQD